MKPSLLLFILLLNCSAIFVGKAQAEEFLVGNLQITFIDPDRNNRPILTEIYYPVTESGEPAPGSFPLLIFGHGFLMTWSAYENLWTHFVSHGYVMAFPRTEGGFSPNHQDFALDIAFLASAIQVLNDDSDSPLYHTLNSRTAAMGHSMGGGAAILATSYSNHIDVYLGLAPAETNPSAISAAQIITQPALIISGSADDVTPESTHQIPIYEALATESRSLVSITGGGHCYFANFNFYCNLGESGTSGNITLTREEQQQTTADITTPWLDFFLKDNCESWDELQDSLQNSSRITFMQNTIIGKPEIILQGDTLYSTKAYSYQWFMDGEPITGAEEAFLIPEISGNYQVETNYFNACKWMSDALQVEMPTSVSGLTDSDIRVYPNPASEIIFIKMPSHHVFSEVQLLSLNGAIQLNLKIKTGQDFNLNVSALQPGYYILQFFGEGKEIVRKVMVK
ncbi:MAG: T9SS type A sorting domain-containing protein [Bacteroidales bacterium]|nr:T9SS type A sorting domain-containing protein [Bacteroidales bacterium]